MDLKTIIIGLIISVIIMFPLVYIQFAQNRKKKNTRKVFMVKAIKSNIKISEADFWGTYYAIALDESQSKLIYSKKVDSENQWLEIDLNAVTDCYIQKTDRKIKNKTTNKVETDKIDLVISTKENVLVLEFYNIDVNIEMTKENQLLEKWLPLIKNRAPKHSQAA